ncbi:MAG: Uma2 family endonuclease [Acidobacteriota bacterium]|nr:Uma2 family endonuclease [Acidobacteriota bacterium]
MAAAHSFLTPERFEQLYSGEKPNVEYWFGKAIQKPMPTSLHSAIAFVISMLLLKRGWKALPEVRLKISQLAHPVPDVVASSKPFQDPYPTDPLDLCVEILSPGDKLSGLFNKAAHYLDWGIETVWIIDPKRHTAFSMSVHNPQPIPVGMSGCLTAGTGEHELSIPLSELFAEVDKSGLVDEAR